MKIMFLGTSSGAGKTTLCAMYCRYLHKKGVKVAPFKAVNLSSVSYKTEDGYEIGIGQALQAAASGTKPVPDMNPVLLKYSDGKLSVYTEGKRQSEIKSGQFLDTESALSAAVSSFDRLSSEYDAVVCEGSGSPAELNMRDRDIANTGMMRERNIPAVLTGDIERGGVFAALYGTWKLMPDDIRPLVKGLVINRFRGDPKLLASGIERIESLTGMKYLGTVPYASFPLPEEDSLSSSGKDNSADIARSVEYLDKMIEAAENSGFYFSLFEKVYG
jgi:adenosylcobyric acid synthase